MINVELNLYIPPPVYRHQRLTQRCNSSKLRTFSRIRKRLPLYSVKSLFHEPRLERRGVIIVSTGSKGDSISRDTMISPSEFSFLFLIVSRRELKKRYSLIFLLLVYITVFCFCSFIEFFPTK